MKTAATKTALETLADYIRENGPIATARISTARCGSCPWQYWDIVPYSIRLRADGRPTNSAQGRAERITRSERKAERMLADVCEREGRIPLQRIGVLSEQDAEFVLSEIAKEKGKRKWKNYT